MEEQSKLVNLDPIAIQKYQQNRFPLLFLDRIVEAVPGKSARAFKCFTYNEWFFPAHFEDEPNVPGFVQIEAMAQTFLMTFLTIPGNEGKKAAAIQCQARFRMKIEPGMRLDLYAELVSYNRGIAKGFVKGSIDGSPACELNIIAGIPDVIKMFSPRV